MKRFSLFLLSGILILGACDNNNSSNKESNNKLDNKTEQNSNNKTKKNEPEKGTNNNSSSNSENQDSTLESNEQTADTNNQESNASQDNNVNDIGEVAAIERAKDFPNGDTIDVQNIDWDSFHIDKDRTNSNEYHVKYYYNGISSPMPFEIIINRETGEKIGANNLANQQQMKEYKNMIEKNEKEKQQRLKELAKENNVCNENNQQYSKENEEQNNKDNAQQTEKENSQPNTNESEQQSSVDNSQQ